MKKIIVTLIALACVVAVFLILNGNKQAAEEKMKKTSMITEFPVTATTVRTQNIDDDLTLVGTLYGNKELTLLSETAGRVVELHIENGGRIGKGAVVLKVDDELKRAALMSAEASFDKAKKDFERMETLFKEKAANESQLDQARFAYRTAESQLITAKRQLADTKIHAPIGGTISSRAVEIGSLLAVNTPICSIVDVSVLKLKVNVAEKDVFRLRAGDKIKIKSDVYPEAEYTGTIKDIADKGDEAHTFPVEIAIQNNSKNPLKAGMFAKAVFESIKKTNVLVIPRSALIGSLKEPQVYVVENGIACLRSVAIANEAGEFLELYSGLNQGETVITNGQINLKDSTKVSVTMQ
jgi:RND family efflux transporter MFP subunit